MESEVDKILKNSSKAELLEKLSEELDRCDRVVVILIEDKAENDFISQTITLGIANHIEFFGILEVAKQDWNSDGQA